eukprot:3932620-Ditylum_brightwellii.AAC.1
MNNRDALDIDSFSFPDEETVNKSKRRTGYNMFVLWYFVDFKMLDEEEKERLLLLSGVWAAPDLVPSDKDSTKTPPTFKAYLIIMTAARHWHSLSDKKKNVWRKQAVKLNSMPVP